MQNYKEMTKPEILCYFMKRIYDADMTTLTGGNISVRDENGVVWMTPTSIDKAALKPEDIVQILPDGSIVGINKPTSEYRIHMGIYHARPDINAVIHAHSPAMIAMSVLHKAPDPRLTFSAWTATKEAVIVPYAIPGTKELGDNVTRAFANGADFTILENHGCFVGSRTDMSDCFKKFEEFDFNARLELKARADGELELADIMLLNELKSFPPSACDSVSDSDDHTELKAQLADIARRAYVKRMFTSVTGTISARTNGNNFVISNAGKDNGTMSAKDFTCITDGAHERGKFPDMTAGFHRAVYEAVPEIGSVIFAAPVTAMISAVTDTDYRTDMIPESYGVLRGCQKCSLKDFLKAPFKYLRNLGTKKPFLMVENYGLFLAAADPVMAFDKLEVCEYSAQEYRTCVHSRLEPKCMSLEALIEAND